MMIEILSVLIKPVFAYNGFLSLSALIAPEDKTTPVYKTFLPSSCLL